MIFLHTEQSVPGRVAETLSHLGHRVILAHPVLGQPLPIALSEVDGLIVMGGPMSVHDSEMRPEQGLIEEFIALDRPFLGICLGAQLLNLIHGGTVGPAADGQVQMGWHSVQGLTPRLDGLRCVYQWHSEWMTPATSLRVTAVDEQQRTQAIECGPHWGVQFHPEANSDVRSRWLARASHKLVGPGAHPGHTHQQQGPRYDPEVARWLTQYLTDWLAQTG